jgi:hypothetical protein
MTSRCTLQGGAVQTAKYPSGEPNDSLHTLKEYRINDLRISPGNAGGALPLAVRSKVDLIDNPTDN